ncbi:16S rRNA (cytidine(1402)-2'-O)-methyltransferase [bacterium]|nr:16S rRNA (cytidine(1402)-2'-O)-methyltransferase [bacterium]
MSLYIVSTPIGNLADITVRAIETLKNVDLIATEDTRHSQILLNKYEINKKCISFHSHSGQAKVEKIINELINGKDVAVISDAGTPGISDPAYVLIKSALENNIEIIPIPGASAFLTALTASGLPINQFIYLGFLPLKKGRKTLLESLQNEKKTVVFYESPHRIIRTIAQLEEFFGFDRKIVIARELTKLHEEFIRGSISEVRKIIESRKPKGEFVVVLGGLGVI